MSKRKRVLKAAKDAVANKFTIRLAELQEQYDELISVGGSSDEIDVVAKEICDTNNELDEWKARAKKNKRKVGKRVSWTAHREQRRLRPKKDHAALEEFKANRKEQAKATVGAEWLYEGALVVKRGKNDMMIVTRIAGHKVECLKNGATQWFRGVSLRPAEWMMED